MLNLVVRTETARLYMGNVIFFILKYTGSDGKLIFVLLISLF